MVLAYYWLLDEPWNTWCRRGGESRHLTEPSLFPALLVLWLALLSLSQSESPGSPPELATRVGSAGKGPSRASQLTCRHGIVRPRLQ